MEKVLAGLRWETAIIFLDDMIIHAPSFGHHIIKLRKVFQWFREAQLQLKLKKCEYLKREVKFLGHIVRERGVETDMTKIERVRNWVTPVNRKQVRTFLGFIGYYRKFVER